MNQKRKYHPYADVFPMMSKQDKDNLTEDIRENGQRDPIIVDENGAILDGRHRYEICLALGIEPRFSIREDDGKLLEWVLSRNLHRRHLDDDGRSFVAARISNLKQGDNQHFTGEQNSVETTSKALNVSIPSVKRARKVLADGSKSLREAAEKGDVSLSAAAKVAALPKAEQRALVRSGPAAVKAAANQKPEPAPEPPQEDKPAPAPMKIMGSLDMLLANWQAASKETRQQFMAKIGLTMAEVEASPRPFVPTPAPQMGRKTKIGEGSFGVDRNAKHGDQFGRERAAPGSLLKNKGANGKSISK